MYRQSTGYFVLTVLLFAMGCGGQKESLTHLLIAGDRIGVTMENELGLTLNSKENEPVNWQLGQLSGVITSWDEEGLSIAVDDTHVPEKLVESFSSERNRLMLSIGGAAGGNLTLNLSFESNDESGSLVIVRFSSELVEAGLRQTEDGLALRI